MLQTARKFGNARWKVVQSLGKRSISTSTSLVIFDRSKINRLLPHSTWITDINLRYCSNPPEKLDRYQFEFLCTKTLNSLSEYFEELVESSPHLKFADVAYSEGVLTIHLGKPYGTYVINRQTPNLQLWLSSPISGPKRYDFINNTWVYKHDNTKLHDLLNKEIKSIVKQEVDFTESCCFDRTN